MNRRKKIKQILKSRSKKGDAKPVKKKSGYVSKAERAKLAEEESQNTAAEDSPE